MTSSPVVSRVVGEDYPLETFGIGLVATVKNAGSVSGIAESIVLLGSERVTA